MKKSMLRLPGVLLTLCLIATPAAAAPAGPAHELAGDWWGAAVALWSQVTGWWESAVAEEPSTATSVPTAPDSSLRAFPEWDPDTAKMQLAPSPTDSTAKPPQGAPSS